MNLSLVTIIVLSFFKYGSFQSNSFFDRALREETPQYVEPQHANLNRLPSNDFFGQMNSEGNFNAEAKRNHKHKIKKKRKKNGSYSNFLPFQLPLQQLLQQQQQYSDPCRNLYRNGKTTDHAALSDIPEGRFFWDLNVYNVYPSTKPSVPIYPSPYPISALLNNCNNFGYAGFGQPNNPFSLAGLSNINLNGNRIGHPFMPTGHHKKKKNKHLFGSLLNNINAEDSQNTNTFNPIYSDNVKPIVEDTSEEQENTGPISSTNFPIRQIGQLIGGVSNRVNDVIQIFAGNGSRGPLIKSFK